MGKRKDNLSDREVSKLSKQAGRHRVSENLYLQVKPSGSASWLFRYMLNSEVVDAVTGKRRGAHWMGLGSYKDFTLAEARQRAREARQLRTDKIDPLEAKRRKDVVERLEAAKSITFGECAAKYIAAHAPTWRNTKHAAQWRTVFEGSARAPAATAEINTLPVGAIDTTLALQVLEPIWTRTPETASRVRQRCEQVIAWATARKYRDGENPFLWRGHLKTLLANPSKLREVKNHPALPYADVPAFMAELRANQYVSARALEFTILTAARTGEAIGATWDEIDIAGKAWTIPASRMKAGKEHRVPLSDRALAILAALPRQDGNPYLFIGAKAGQPLSNMAMLKLLKHARPGKTVHGFRSSFRDWAAECTATQNHVVEMALAHIVKGVEGDYRRGDMFEKRRRLMAEWTRYCAAPPAKHAANVTPMRRGKA